MIVRIMGEGQYRVDDELRAKLNELDDRAMAALERDDEPDLDAALDEMADARAREGNAGARRRDHDLRRDRSRRAT